VKLRSQWRKRSSEHGLEQEFNSLHAQRERSPRKIEMRPNWREHRARGREELSPRPETNGKPECQRCGMTMIQTHSLPRTEIMPAVKAFRCNSCGKTLLCKLS
jgi:hypothetical protein